MLATAAAVAFAVYACSGGAGGTTYVPISNDSASAVDASSPLSMDNLPPGWDRVPEAMRPHFFSAAEKSGCAMATPQLLAGIAQIESGFNPKAVSSAGAKGVMQIMDNTLASAGVADPFNPAEAIPGAARVLCAKEKATSKLTKYPTLMRTLAAYNGGEGNVKASGIPASMQRYAENVIAASKLYEDGTADATAAVLQTTDRKAGVCSPGMGYKAMEAMLKKAFPNVVITSRFRAGSITSSGKLSYHAQGKALDIEPTMAIFDWLATKGCPNSTELIFTPAGKRQLWHGKPHVYSGAVAAAHYDHIHWAVK